MTLQQILDNRSIISAKVIEDIKDVLLTWGFSVSTFEISNIEAADRHVREALKNQINAEQDSKEKHIKADS
eukprot:CAMPEP_0116922866 /NCGR_PEP_ID=MMETSP0467-20121206/22520_1 /TAXON_ID=283647 /ORGANISM="Mesodinium pulex, Strain SPMC105" /LENGTH=70 /DNA_ID=CAMNT_0004601285 /DNA_START=391 /DNA_END=603 /DNA_ORIENTATION=+